MNNRTVNKIAKLQKANDELQQKIDMLQGIDNWEDWMLANRDLATARKGDHQVYLSRAEYSVVYESIVGYWRKQIQGNRMKLEKL